MLLDSRKISSRAGGGKKIAITNVRIIEVTKSNLSHDSISTVAECLAIDNGTVLGTVYPESNDRSYIRTRFKRVGILLVRIVVHAIVLLDKVCCTNFLRGKPD